MWKRPSSSFWDLPSHILDRRRVLLGKDNKCTCQSSPKIFHQKNRSSLMIIIFLMIMLNQIQINKNKQFFYYLLFFSLKRWITPCLSLSLPTQRLTFLEATREMPRHDLIQQVPHLRNTFKREWSVLEVAMPGSHIYGGLVFWSQSHLIFWNLE